jgi:hypothetical protein
MMKINCCFRSKGADGDPVWNRERSGQSTTDGLVDLRNAQTRRLTRAMETSPVCNGIGVRASVRHGETGRKPGMPAVLSPDCNDQRPGKMLGFRVIYKARGKIKGPGGRPGSAVTRRDCIILALAPIGGASQGGFAAGHEVDFGPTPRKLAGEVGAEAGWPGEHAKSISDAAAELIALAPRLIIVRHFGGGRLWFCIERNSADSSAIQLLRLRRPLI